VYIVAGEASGDVLGARLIAALRKLRPELTFTGIGGARMKAENFTSIFPMEDLAVMGLAEILPRIFKLRRRLQETVAAIKAQSPAIVVTIDSPGFNLRLLKEIAPLGIKRVQYVAPQVWAWREHRVKKFPGLWDDLLCLLPFEPEFFARHGIKAHFTGHPVLQSGAEQGDATRFRAHHNIPPDAPIVVLMPGSRKTEAPRLLPVFAQTMARLTKYLPNVVAVIPVSAAVAPVVQAAAASFPTPPILVTNFTEKHDAYAAAGAALTKSGTSTLELALAGVPMAVTYRVNPITGYLARKLIKVPYVAMVNLLAGRQLVPELLQQDCAPQPLARALHTLLTDPRAAQSQRTGFASVIAALRAPAGDPSTMAAEAVLSVLDRDLG